MNSIDLDLASFAKILNENKNQKLIKWKDILTMYNNTVGGCDCSKKAREISAQNYFVVKINNQPKEDFEELKNILKVDKILFKSSDGNTFLEV